MKIRVLHVMRSPITFQSFLRPIASEQVRRGHTVEVAFGRGADFEPQDVATPLEGVTYRTFRVERSANPAALLRSTAQLRDIIWRGGYDLIVAHMFLGGLIGRLAAAWAGGQRVLYACQALGCYPARPGFIRWPMYWLERALGQGTDSMIVLNDHDWRLVRDRPFLRRGRPLFKLTSVGVDVAAIQARAAAVNRQGYFRQLSLEPSLPLVSFVGRLIREKGPDLFLDLTERFLAEGGQAQFIVVGSGPLEAFVRRRLQKRGLAERVHLLGWRNDVVELLSVSDVYCLPTENEGAPVAVQEAMACGVAVLASRVPGCVDVVRDGVTGLLADWPDSADFARQLRRLISDAEFRRRLGRQALQEARRRLDIGVCAPQWADAFEAAAGRKHGESA